jgi:hypothetical protein
VKYKTRAYRIFFVIPLAGDRIPKLTEEEWERWKRETKALIDGMVANPQAAMAKYPRYRELQRDLAEAFLIETTQEENPKIRREIESGQMKRAKVFVDVAWDADAYDKWRREEEVKKGIGTSLLLDLMPPNFGQMTEQEIKMHFEENRDKFNRAFSRARRRTRYTGP